MNSEIKTNLNIFYIGYIDKDNTFIIESLIECVNLLELKPIFENKNFLYLIKNNKEKNNFGYYYIFKDIKNKNGIIRNYYEIQSNKINENNNLLDESNIKEEKKENKEINSSNENEIKNNIKILLEIYKYNKELKNLISNKYNNESKN